MSNRSRRDLGRGQRSQPRFVLQGKQLLHASLSTLSLPPTTHPHPPSQPSHLTGPSSTHSFSTQPVQGVHKYPEKRQPQAQSPHTACAEPDYRHMARRRKQFALVAKTVTADKILQTQVPEGETLHSFLLGGRYNSAHHIDSHSLQRIGVYVPRNTRAKTFINPARTTPPSPAVFGMHPLKKHMSLVSPTTSPSPDSLTSAGQYTTSPEESLFLIRQNLKRQLCMDRGASMCSLLSEQKPLESNVCSREGERGVHVLDSQTESSTHSVDDCGKQEGREEDRDETKKVSTSGTKGGDGTSSAEGFHSQCHGCLVSEGGGGEASSDGGSRRGSASDDSVVVSESDLLSPEAQMLTQEILLETASMHSDLSHSINKNTTTTTGEGMDASSTKQEFAPNECIYNRAISSCDTLTDNGSSEQISTHQLAEETSRLQLAEQTSRHQLAEQTYRHSLVQQIFRPEQTSPLEEKSSEPLREQALRAHSELQLVAISRHHSTAIPARPQSASKAREDRNDRVPRRPQSARQVLHKQVSHPEKTGTIFVDLSKLHPLPADDAADNSDDEDRK